MPCWQSVTAADHSGVPAAWSVSKGMLTVQSGCWCHCSPHVACLCVSFKVSLSPYLRHPAHWTILARASLLWRTGVCIASCCGCSRQFQIFPHANSPPRMQAGSWRTDLTDQRGSWLREEMPAPRVMPWSCLLPDGTVFVMGGAENGETCPVTRFWMGSARGCTLSGCPVPDRELDCQPWMLPRLHAHL